MATTKPESELASIERQAEELARGRKERVTSAHLLAAKHAANMADEEDQCRGLLPELCKPHAIAVGCLNGDIGG